MLQQLKNMWGGITNKEKYIIDKSLNDVIERCLRCFRHINNKYYNKGENVIFSATHSCQYTFFLYFISNTIYNCPENSEGKFNILCDKIYMLIKIIAGCDLYYQINLPNVFSFDHPVGTVLGRAQYGEYFAFAQNCTVGNNNGEYPIFGSRVVLNSGCTVLGNSRIGSNVILGANTYILDVDIPDNSIVYGENPRNITIVHDENKIKKILENYYK